MPFSILIGREGIVKISDFGTSREWKNEMSTKMSFAGTVAWMAPEVIKNEPCSEKVDIWSYGIVLWELLTCEIPYRDVDSSAIIWGVGNNNLHLPIPTSCPEGLALLIKQCWSVKPRNRPSFRIILNHLEIAGNELLRQPEKEYFEAQQEWRKEVQTKMSTVGKSSHRMEQDLIKKRQEELRHAKDIRLAYERKLEKTNQMCLEVNILLQQLHFREKEVAEREKLVLQPGYLKNQRKFTTSIKKAQDKIYRKYMNQQVQQTAAATSSSLSPAEAHSVRPTPVQLCAQLDGNERPRSSVVVRKKRMGSGTIASPKSSPSRERRYQSEPRPARLVHSETQTNADDFDVESSVEEEEIRAASFRSDAVDGSHFRDTCSTPDDLMPDDQMVSSSEQLELRESSDEDNLEILGRQVSELSERFSLGNSSFKRAYVSAEVRNGEVTVLRCKSSRAANSEGEESWTDDEGGESQSDSNYSLRRKRYVLVYVVWVDDGGRYL